MTVEPAKELGRLYTVEYGDPTEVGVRLVGVSLGSALLFLYTGWLASWLWAGFYLAAHAMQFANLQRRNANATLKDVQRAGALFIVVLIAFIWMPTYLAGNADPGLSFVGSMLMATTFVFLIRRADTLAWMVALEIGSVAVVLCWVLVQKILQIHETVPRIACAVVVMVVVAYMANALFHARKIRLAGEEAAERASQEQKLAAIGQLAGGVAHDFNNVLTAISGNLELYHVLPDAEERDHVVNEAHAAAKRAEEVVRALLIYARKAPVRRQVVDVNESVGHLIGLSRRLVPQSVQTRLTLSPESMHVLVDDNQLLTAMINIVVNAADAMPAGGTLGIDTSRAALENPRSMIDGHDLAPGTYVVLRFSDTGFGIPQKNLRKVVEPFFTTKPPGKGTGLGLSMVLGFANESGGGLEVRSNSGGTRITIFLPSHEDIMLK